MPILWQYLCFFLHSFNFSIQIPTTSSISFRRSLSYLILFRTDHPNFEFPPIKIDRLVLNVRSRVLRSEAVAVTEDKRTCSWNEVQRSRQSVTEGRNLVQSPLDCLLILFETRIMEENLIFPVLEQFVLDLPRNDSWNIGIGNNSI
jgi:hypothetical protein